MRSLIRVPQTERGTRDPAPSRLGYRIQRLMLTPGFRGMVRIGVPILLIAAIATSWYSKPENRAALSEMIARAQNEFQERPQFMVRGARVTGAGEDVSLAIAAYLPQEYPLSSFDMDLDLMRGKIEALDEVKSASLRVGNNGLLQVLVTPREPVAVWRDGTLLRLIDADGVISGRIAVRADRLDLPLIAGDGAEQNIAEALSLFATAAPLRDRLRGLVRMGERRWDLVLDRDQRILLPGLDPVGALDRVLALDAAQELLGRDVVVVDMRNTDRPTVRLSADATAALRQTGQPTNTSNGAGN